ncbi:secreted RxLR effector protein 161-like [Vigna angularis]|uniref:secreted RxLR effector protein 161-like n=1 Tax=Phaseolus angularis TaxID=3914 RepID=UPI0022B4DFAC|nr:secreted RxLR effector protein 161-like [Vigna angularis]
MSKPKKSHMQAAKRVIQYIKGTRDYCILFLAGRKKTAMEITRYTDSNYGGDMVERKSTSGYIFMLNNTLISWCSKKQLVVAFSSCEVEFIAESYGTCQGIWIKELMEELKVSMENLIQLKIDNVSAINLAKNLVSHGRSKHIEVKFYFLKDMVKKGRIILAYCKKGVQLVDLFTVNH